MNDICNPKMAIQIQLIIDNVNNERVHKFNIFGVILVSKFCWMWKCLLKKHCTLCVDSKKKHLE